MALIDFEVHNNEMQARNALIQEARSLLEASRVRAKKGGGNWLNESGGISEHSKKVTAFLNDSKHEKYEYTEPEK